MLIHDNRKVISEAVWKCPGKGQVMEKTSQMFEYRNRSGEQERLQKIGEALQEMTGQDYGFHNGNAYSTHNVSADFCYMEKPRSVLQTAGDGDGITFASNGFAAAIQLVRGFTPLIPRTQRKEKNDENKKQPGCLLSE